MGLSPSVRDRLVAAAVAEAPWLYHPVACAVMSRPTIGRDLRLAVWAAANMEDDLGEVTLETPEWIWGPEGGASLDPGRYALCGLAEQICSPPDEFERLVELDPWCDSVGLPLDEGVVNTPEWGWPHRQPLTAEDEQRLRRGLVTFLEAGARLHRHLPTCADWVRHSTKVVVPLYSCGGQRFRSGSCASLPGLVFSDLEGPHEQILETLVHESAHHWLIIAEAEGPLVDPSHYASYASPLRQDPRPLRGIFLAFHALAFMTAFYHDWFRALGAGEKQRQLQMQTRALRDDACATLNRARSALTDLGRELLDTTTARVVAYAD
ncbi:aKG-HExxH-type peptide beta-hydroxylase [Sphingomonas psychrotolerans]|uniref:aKG-HExxH-type peptide beta-hydroxylase n=1 Tax=Sphingomonas psychrotolerans TaxID=1327635 RepID=UPI001305246D|nr:HEXXH motif-containing putative peptide modification protein [Sphingomonas psychrotolerans]